MDATIRRYIVQTTLQNKPQINQDQKWMPSTDDSIWKVLRIYCPV
jgi:hypothetical protein